jgi:hypothetical protein
MTTRPNTSGTRGGAPTRRPLPLAEQAYSENDEQAFRRQLDVLLRGLQSQIDFLSAFVAGGSFTMGAASSHVVADIDVAADSIIALFPTNASGATLQAGAHSLYISAKSAGVSFTVATADAAAAAGTETFGYIIIG